MRPPGIRGAVRILTVGLSIVTPVLCFAAIPVYVSPDVPTRETLGGTDLLPWQAVRYDGIAYTPALTVPGNPLLADIHRLDAPGNWLLALETPSDFAGGLPSAAQTRDVVRYDNSAATFALILCGGSLVPAIPTGIGIDALYLDGGDAGDLVVSFDAPVTLGTFSFRPADLVRYVHSGPGCGGWTLAATNPEFNSALAGSGIPISSNLIAAARSGSKYVLSFDVPTSPGPPGLTTYVPGQLVTWDGATFSLFQVLGGWPISGQVSGVSTAGNPGRVPPTINLAKAGVNLTIHWEASCSSGGEDYSIYEGTIGSWYSHTAKVCTDSGQDLTETFAPGAGNLYYLVVPHNSIDEGSYGRASSGTERPRGIAQCTASQNLTNCP